MLPQHPRSIAAVVSVVELGPFLEGIGRFPESFIPIAEQPSLPGERAADVRDEITSGRQQVEDLLVSDLRRLRAESPGDALVGWQQSRAGCT